MSEEKQEKLPLDAKLLADAVIELNISRRSVGLYPPDHPIVRAAIEQAFNHLRKLFEIRSSITLGIVKEMLVIDEFTLDRRNPVYREFALSLHERGVAAITFTTGIAKEELVRFHELISCGDLPSGESLAERSRSGNIRHIVITPLKFDHFRFVEGARGQKDHADVILEDYVFNLLEGTLSENDSGALWEIAPGDVASCLNAHMSEDSRDEAYDSVITAYLRKKDEPRLSRETVQRFFTFLDGLRPELKRQFLSRSSGRITEDIGDIEMVLGKMKKEDFEKVAEMFLRNASVIPKTLKNLIDKLSISRPAGSRRFDAVYGNMAVVDDMEFGGDIIKLFDEDHSRAFISEEYLRDLGKMVQSSVKSGVNITNLREECSDEVIDRNALEIILELMEGDFLIQEDYLALLTRLAEMSEVFVETGRFEEIIYAYNAVRAHALKGRFGNQTLSILDYFFHSEVFVGKIMAALKFWGRKDREASRRLVKAFRRVLIEPVFIALSEAEDPAMRRFYLSLLEAIGSDIITPAIRRLHDERWYVVRNMVYLLRECNARSEVQRIRQLAKHSNRHVCLEAVKTLLHFCTPDAVTYLRFYCQSDDRELQRGAVKLAGLFRVREAVPLLIRLLSRSDLFGSRLDLKREIIKALGEIGDPAAVGPLMSIYRGRTLFPVTVGRELRQEISNSLGRYPAEAVAPLTHMLKAAGIETGKRTSINEKTEDQQGPHRRGPGNK